MLDWSEKTNDNHFAQGPKRIYVPPSMVIVSETGCVHCEVQADEDEQVQDLNVTQSNIVCNLRN